MTTRPIPVITKWLMAVIVVLAVLSSAGIAGADPTLDEQLIRAGARGGLTLIKCLLDRAGDAEFLFQIKGG